MNRTHFILLLLVVAMIGNPSVTVPAENGVMSLIEAQREAHKMKLHRQREIRRQRADAQAEVLFWFRTHPTERVFPQQEVDRMLKSGGYNPVAVEGLTGSQNPFFTETCP